VESHGAGSVARNSAASTMILRRALNSRRPEILMASAVRPIQTSSMKTIVKEATIVTVKNAGKIRWVLN
jgi:hypothetical protein